MKYLLAMMFVDFLMILIILVLMAKLRMEEYTYRNLRTKLAHMKIRLMLIENKLNKS